MPSVRSWIHSLTKEELAETLARFQLGTAGTTDELRRRLKAYADSSPADFSHVTENPAETADMNDRDRDPSPAHLADTMNLVRKWGCRFTGKDPHAFLERVEELREAYGLANDQLLRCLPELITGDALLWYRNNREAWATWADFLAEFRLNYIPRRTNTELEREIRDLIQLPSESFGTFVTAMQTLMRRQGGMTASQQLDRIYENMNPAYRLYVQREKVTGIGQLRQQITRYEEIEVARKEYQARVAKKTGSGQAPTTPKERTGTDTAVINPAYKRSECCWNCGQRGHRKPDCRRPFVKFCSVCGKTGVLTRDCHPPGNGQPAGSAAE